MFLCFLLVVLRSACLQLLFCSVLVFYLSFWQFFASFEDLLVPHLVHRFPVRRRRISGHRPPCFFILNLRFGCKSQKNDQHLKSVSPPQNLRFVHEKFSMFSRDRALNLVAAANKSDPNFVLHIPTPNLHIQRTQMTLVLVEKGLVLGVLTFKNRHQKSKHQTTSQLCHFSEKKNRQCLGDIFLIAFWGCFF